MYFFLLHFQPFSFPPPSPPSLDSRVLQDKKLSQQQPVKELCDYLLSQQVPSPHLLAIMVDMYEEEASEGDKESLVKAKEVGGAWGDSLWRKCAERKESNYHGLFFKLFILTKQMMG